MSGNTVIVKGKSSSFVQDVQMGPHRLVADEPLDDGGTDTGPSPYDLLLASLGTCTSMTVSAYARRKNWPLQSVHVQLKHAKVSLGEPVAEGGRAPQKDQIERDIQLIGELSAEQHERLLDIANRCPIHRTLTSDIIINTRLV
ncbi:MAG TPA: OsmC family protein [Oligoflexus sp.]|uniref:OsmC family protein n=1 Tax=Oligoflexus sp. TaxID=1971216 RepID=UPI002D39F504|nr:OsmC family protein [Oligoflexus sp.]HYX36144.1 OsmC family protein [Oligoflexus sp.]